MSHVIKRGSALALAVTIGASALHPSPARADGAACADAAERSQKARKAGKLLEARALVSTCAAPSCPALVRTDCQTWVLELEKELPSIVVRARRAGKDVTEGTVEVDGRPLEGALDGHATPLDPGRHEARYRRGDVTLVEPIVLSPGEKNRMVVFELEGPKEPPKPPKDSTPSASAAPPRESSNTLGWVFGGVAIAGIGTFAVFQGMGQSEYASAKEGCGAARTCDEETLSPIRTKLTISGVGLGVGLAGLAALGVFLLVHDSAGPRSKTGWVAPSTFVF